MSYKKDLLIITGVRPQYIKAKALIDAFAKITMHQPKIHVLNIGQHYSDVLSAYIINDLKLKIDKSFNHNQNASANEIISKSIIGIERYIKNNMRNTPVFLVFGDANPALAGCISGVKMGADIVHVEAGSRRERFEQEDLNSRMIDSVADLKLCISCSAYKNLDNEGNAYNSIITGDMAYNYYNDIIIDYKKNKINGNKVLITLHRPQNMNRECVDNMVSAIVKSKLSAVWITHPRIMKIIDEYKYIKEIDFIEPLTFHKVLIMLNNCSFVITDSGGLSREAHYFKKYVLMRRDNGGWPELRNSGLMKNIGKNYQEVQEAIRWCLDKKNVYPNINVFYKNDGVRLGLNGIIKLLNSNYIKNV
jgi:UDP-GlcNAc3NAcA epimerase